MGNHCCAAGRNDAQQRQQLLMNGNEFKKRSSFFSVLKKTERIHLKLNAQATRLQWSSISDKSNPIGEIPICRIGNISCETENDMIILSITGQKLLELIADSPSVRDLWADTLEELREKTWIKGNDSDSLELQNEINKVKEQNKEKYWKERTAELEKRKLEAEERKRKFGTVGLKYTAQAMSQR